MDQNELITQITNEVMKRLQSEISKQGVQLVGKFSGADPASLALDIDHTMLRPEATLARSRNRLGGGGRRLHFGRQRLCQTR